MLVRDWMSTKVITVEAGAPLSEALDLLENYHIGMLPVLREGKLVGMVTDYDLRPFASRVPSVTMGLDYSLVLSRVKVEDVMSRSHASVPVDYTIEEVADVLLRNEIPGAVVVDAAHKIVGVITQTDISRVLVSVTGLWRGGIVYGFLLEDRAGSIKELTDIVRAYGGRLASILTSYERAPRGYRAVHIRVRKLDRNRLQELENELKEKATILYKVDQRLNTREIFENTQEK
ncbi:MAG TPA: CBS and ACT domain-containing protein [Syntrophobacteraceae bacterium]|nr:CBS and ACT domain-containing protein [Syntrophobacteraceae bacterium]